MRIGVISDVHAPFHGDEYYLAIDILSERVDHLIINGDFLDMYGCNFYGVHPSVTSGRVEHEINWCIDELERLNKLFDKITFLFGNHEYRFERKVLQIPQFFNLCNLQTCLHLDRFKIDWLPYQKEYLIKKDLRIVHSPPSYSVNLARTSLMKKPGASYIYGCSHRIDYAVMNLSTGGTCEVYSNGWLGSVDKTEEHRQVFSYMKGHQAWQSGFCIIDIDYKDQHHIEQVHIKNGQCKADGFIWEM